MRDKTLIITRNQIRDLVDKIQLELDRFTEPNPKIDTSVYVPGLKMAGVLVEQIFEQWKKGLDIEDESRPAKVDLLQKKSPKKRS